MEEKSNLGKIIKWNLIIYFGVSFLELITAKLMMGNTADGYTGVFFMILSMMSVGLAKLHSKSRDAEKKLLRLLLFFVAAKPYLPSKQRSW